MKETIYIVSKATIYDSDLEMWGTKVGTEGKQMPLLLTAWGITESHSRTLAEHIVNSLKN